MSILDHKEVHHTGMTKLRDFQKLDVIEQKLETTGNTQHGTDRNEEHILRLRIGVSFWANQAQLPEAIRNAEKEILRCLYSDVIGITHSLRDAIFADDAKQALHYIDQMYKKLGI